MPTIHTTIEIAAPPSTVRVIFLDFPAHPTWHTSFFKSITTTKPPSNPSLLPGSTLSVKISPGDSEMTLTPTITTNTPHEFSWTGKLWGMPGLFTGTHSFKFVESQDPANVGGTRFEHGEVFTGVAAGLIREGGVMYANTRKGFEGFNGDLKGRCERQ